MKNNKGFLAWLYGFAEKRGTWSGPLTSSSPELARLWGGTPSSTGVSVSEDTALNYSAVWAAVTLISSQIASLPLILYKRLPNGGKERLTTHKLYRILHSEPNAEMTSFTLREIMMAHVLTWGNAYAEIQRNGAGAVVALWPITPDRVSVKRDTRTLEVYYEVSRPYSSGTDRVAAMDMLHIAGFGFDGLMGYSPIAKQRDSIGLGLATEKFGGTFFGNGATFGGVISLGPGEQLTEAAQKSFREKIDAQHQGVDRAHKFLLLGNQAKYERLGIPPNDAQFLETRKFQIEEVARWYNLAPYKLRRTEGTASYASIEQQAIEHVTDCLRPWLVRCEQEYDRKLIAPSERTIQFTEHLVDGILRGDQASRNASYAVARQWGWLSVDDIRERENLNPLPDKQGQIYLVPMNMSPANRLNEIVDKQVEPDPKPVAPAPPAARDEPAETERMVETLRTALVDVEARIAEHVTKAAAAEARLDGVQQSNVELEAVAADHRAQAEQAKIEAARLQAVLLLANERADREAAEKEAIRIAAEARAETLAREAALAKAATEAVRTAADAVRAHATSEAERLTAALAEAEQRAVTVATDKAAADADVTALRAQVATTDAALADAQWMVEAERIAATAEAVRLQQALTEALAVAEARTADHQAATVTVETLQAGLAEAQARLTTVETERETAREAEARLQADLEATRALVAQSEQDQRVMQQTSAAAVIRLDHLQIQLAEKDEKLAGSDAAYLIVLAERDAAQASARAAAERLEAVMAETGQKLAELAETQSSTVAEAERAHQVHVALEAKLAKAVAEGDVAGQRLAEAEAREATERDAHAATNAQLRAAKEAETARLQALIGAIRAQVAYVVGMCVAKEIERAKRNGGTPQKLLAWADGFYLNQEANCIDALRHILQGHLAFIGSTDDVDTYAKALVKPHLDAAIAQLRAVALGDPEDFPVGLERLMSRWERDRPAAIADVVLQEEVSYVRSL